MAVSDNLKKARKSAGLSQAEMAEKLGLNLRTYGSYERGERDLSTSLLLNICKTLRISSDELLDTGSTADHEMSTTSNLTLETPYHVPIFNSVSAGFGAYASSDIVGYMPMVIANPHDFKDTICIKVTGDSMYPKIEDGDVITVRKQASVDNGQIAVVRIGDECVVKKVELGKNFLKMVSINPEYKDRILTGPELEGVEIVGLVQQVTKKL